MGRLIWAFPVPSTAFLEDVAFQKLRRRSCSLETTIEGAENGVKRFVLAFHGLEAFKCTYYKARSLAMADAYDRIIDCENSPWLEEIKTQLARDLRSTTQDLKHYMVNFDDGPCYEFICRQVEAKVDTQLIFRDPPNVLC